MADLEAPENSLAHHPLTDEMRKRGMSDAQLESLRFTPGQDGTPFSEWVFRGPGDMPAPAIPLGKAYCTLKWLLLDAPPASRNRDDAYQYITNSYAEQLVSDSLLTKAESEKIISENSDKIEKYDQFKASQKEKSKMMRRKIGNDRLSMPNIVRKFAAMPDNYGLEAKDLWNSFQGFLRDQEVIVIGPTEEVPLVDQICSYEDDHDGTISYKYFRRLLAQVRKVAARGKRH